MDIGAGAGGLGGRPRRGRDRMGAKDPRSPRRLAPTPPTSDYGPHAAYPLLLLPGSAGGDKEIEVMRAPARIAIPAITLTCFLLAPFATECLAVRP